MRSLGPILTATFFLFCNVIFGFSALEVREMPSSEVVVDEKMALQRKSDDQLPTSSLHIPFDKEHYSYSSEEWKPVEVLIHQFDPLDKMMMSVVSTNPNKQVTISLDLPNYSSVILSYYVFLTKSETNSPELKVLLASTDGMDKLLKIEEPKGSWMKSSIKIISERGDKIVFVAKLRNSSNEIGLRFVTVQKMLDTIHESGFVGENGYKGDSWNVSTKTTNTSQPSLDEHDDFAYNASNEGNYSTLLTGRIDSLNITNFTEANSRTSLYIFSDGNAADKEKQFAEADQFSTQDSTTKISKEVTFSTHSLMSPIVESSNVSFINKDIKNVSDDDNAALNDKFSNTNYNNINMSSNVFDDSKKSTKLYQSIKNNSIFSNNKTALDSMTNPLDDSYDTEFRLNQTERVNATLEDRNGKIHYDDRDESSRGIFQFFLVIMLTSSVVFLFMYIRRKRRRRGDELPVLRRSATEHGNPTYLDDDTEWNVGFSSSNYRSFT